VAEDIMAKIGIVEGAATRTGAIAARAEKDVRSVAKAIQEAKEDAAQLREIRKNARKEADELKDIAGELTETLSRFDAAFMTHMDTAIAKVHQLEVQISAATSKAAAAKEATAAIVNAHGMARETEKMAENTRARMKELVGLVDRVTFFTDATLEELKVYRGGRPTGAPQMAAPLNGTQKPAPPPAAKPKPATSRSRAVSRRAETADPGTVARRKQFLGG
jgi:ABC-type Zn uptake system ZnuABC Zn-binding protein ZnuA